MWFTLPAGVVTLTAGGVSRSSLSPRRDSPITRTVVSAGPQHAAPRATTRPSSRSRARVERADVAATRPLPEDRRRYWLGGEKAMTAATLHGAPRGLAMICPPRRFDARARLRVARAHARRSRRGAGPEIGRAHV